MLGMGVEGRLACHAGKILWTVDSERLREDLIQDLRTHRQRLTGM